MTDPSSSTREQVLSNPESNNSLTENGDQEIGNSMDSIYVDMRDVASDTVNHTAETPQSDAQGTPTQPYRNFANRFINFYVERVNNMSGNANNPNTEHQAEALNTLAWKLATRPPAQFIFAVMALLCLILAIAKEMMQHLGLLLSLFISLMYFQDQYKFHEIQKGENSHSLIPVVLCIVIRNTINFLIIRRIEILRVVVLMFVPGGESSFVITICRVILAEIVVADVALLLKITCHLIPLNQSQKRRVNLFIDHTSYIYRMLIPLDQWTSYFSTMFMFVSYVIFKVYFFITRVILWFKFIRIISFSVKVGDAVSPDDIEPGSTCSICQQPYNAPRKMTCSHIFCTNCITTWIETNKGNSCPLCRSHVLPQNTLKFSDFEEDFPLNVF